MAQHPAPWKLRAEEEDELLIQQQRPLPPALRAATVSRKSPAPPPPPQVPFSHTQLPSSPISLHEELLVTRLWQRPSREARMRGCLRSWET